MHVAMLLHKTVLHDSRVRREASALAAAGHRVTVLELAPVPPGEEVLDGFHRRSVLTRAAASRRLHPVARRLAMAEAFVRGALRLRPDVIHAHDAAMLLPGLAVAKLLRVPLVYDSHELAASVPYRDRSWAAFVDAIERLAVPRADAVITVSDGIAEALQERYALRQRPAVVRNVTALRATAARPGGLRARLGLDGAPLVLHQGAAAPDRGCETLVHAIGHVDGAHLVFLGPVEPGFAEPLRAAIEEAGVADRVHRLDALPLDALLPATAEADVGVTLLQDTCENHRLALPNKVFEYIAAGVPVVASDLPELRRLVVGHGAGWVVDPADPVAVAAGLRAALDHRDDAALRERLATAARSLDWQNEKERLVDVYRTLEAARPVAPPAAARAMLVVRNDVRFDARVRREAEALADLGAEALVVGVRTAPEQPKLERVGGAAVLRLDPPSLRRGRPAAPAAAPPAPSTQAAPPRAAPAGADPGWRDRARRAWRTLQFSVSATRVVARTRPALVHCNDLNTMWVGIAARCLGSRVLYDSHELWPDRNGRVEKRWWLLACEALFVRCAHATITASPGYARELARRHRIAEPAVVRNVPRAKGAAPSAAVPSLDPPRTAVYVGAVFRHRGLEETVRALPLAPGWRLAVLGPGHAPYLEHLRRLAGEHDVADRLELLGPVPPEQVEARVAALDPVVGLSLIQPVCRSYELTLPNKLYEYALAGLPQIVADLPVMREWIEANGVGAVVDPTDPAAVARALDAAADPGRQAAWRAAAAALRDSEPWREERRRLQDVYRRLLAGRAA